MFPASSFVKTFAYTCLLQAAYAQLIPEAPARQDPALVVNAVCSSSGCLVGNSSIGAGVTVTGPTSINASSSTVVLLPGSYTATTPHLNANSTNTTFSLTGLLSSTPAPFSGFTSSTTGNGITVAFALDVQMLLYPRALYTGAPQQITTNTSSASPANLAFSSILVADNQFAVLNVTASSGSVRRVVLYDGVADTTHWGLGQTGQVIDVQSTSCRQPCGSAGFCTSEGNCACRAGFSGTTCNQCEAGFFGPNCQQCSCSNGEACSEGVSGSGICIAPARNVTTAAQTCNCLNGVCDGSNTCACNAGWADASNGGQRCSVCDEGFALSSSGECLACQPGCTSCTADRCLSCAVGLAPSSSDPLACEATTFLRDDSNTQFTSCPEGAFNNNGTCAACDASCISCHGAGADNCLKCTRPRSLLARQCVDVDSSTGICNKALSSNVGQTGANAIFIVDNSKIVCDSAPVHCTSARIPNFSVTSSRSDIECTACLAGSFLSLEKTCVDSCPDGQFGLIADDSTAQCQTCDSSCASCGGSADNCTTCSSGFLKIAGKCVKASSCPTGTFFDNTSNSCLSCSADCATCSGSFDKCDTCNPSRPVLSSAGSCLQTCARNEYFDQQASSCKSCDSSCETCWGSDKDQCLSCNDQSTLTDGSCIAATCVEGSAVVEGFGVCLEHLITTNPEETSSSIAAETGKKKPLNIGAIVGASVGMLFLLLLLAFFVRRCMRKKRLAKTQGFQDKKGMEQGPRGITFKSLQLNARNILRRNRQRRDSADSFTSPEYTKADRDFINNISGPTKIIHGPVLSANSQQMYSLPKASPPEASPDSMMANSAHSLAPSRSTSPNGHLQTPLMPQHSGSSNSSRNPFFYDVKRSNSGNSGSSGRTETNPFYKPRAIKQPQESDDLPRSPSTTISDWPFAQTQTAPPHPRRPSTIFTISSPRSPQSQYPASPVSPRYPPQRPLFANV